MENISSIYDELFVCLKINFTFLHDLHVFLCHLSLSVNVLTWVSKDVFLCRAFIQLYVGQKGEFDWKKKKKKSPTSNEL